MSAQESPPVRPGPGGRLSLPAAFEPHLCRPQEAAAHDPTKPLADNN